MISNYARLLSKSSAGLDERAQMFVQHVENGALRMDNLLRAMKEYWTIERIERDPSFLDTGIVLESALRNLHHAIEDTGAEVTSDGLPRALAHETPLLEVFQNLVSNALKYRREGMAPRIHVSARQQDGEWEFSVADNGIGIPPKHIESVFQPFKRLHGDKIPGAGMGLAICSRIVKQLGGRIWVESDGSGSTFRFTLPTDGTS